MKLMTTTEAKARLQRTFWAVVFLGIICRAKTHAFKTGVVKSGLFFKK
jgi:hypothetical protein